jgi:hypothetical protein
MLLKTVEASMLETEFVEPRINGFAGAVGVLAVLPLAPGDGAGSKWEEAGVKSVAPDRGLDKGIQEVVPGLSLWYGLAALWGFPRVARKRYHTALAKTQMSSIAGSHFFISVPQFKLLPRGPTLGGIEQSICAG